MRKYILLILFFNSFLLFAQESNYFVYKVFNNSKSTIQDNRKLDGIIGQNNDTINYELFFDQSRALFTPIYKLNNSQEFQIDLNELFIKTQGSFYYDYDKKIVENQKITLGSKYVITKNFDDIQWEISDETDTIQNFICKKAILKIKEFSFKEKERDYIISVWFTDKFKHNIAPFGLVGLNGLIVKVDFNGTQQVLLDRIGMKEKIKKIEPFKDGKKISQSEHDTLIKNYLEKIKERRESLLN